MTLLTRRSLITGFAAMLAAPAVVKAASLMPVRALVPNMPILWGDGIHDDHAALQAVMDGLDVVRNGIVLRGDRHVVIEGGEYLISKTIFTRRLPADRHVLLKDMRLKSTDSFDWAANECLLYVAWDSQISFEDSLEYLA